MFIPYLRQYCLFLVLLTCATNVSANVYKWVDEDGETHYSQIPPKEQQVELIKAPPPPAIDPNKAQQQLDQLIEQQSADRKAQDEQRKQAVRSAEQENIRQQNCQTAKRNLQQYQDNPGRRSIDEDGNVVHLKEEDRQQKIKQQQQSIKEFCP